MRISDWSSDVCSSNLGNFAQRIKAPKIDENNVDHIGATAFGIGMFHEITRNAVRWRPRHGRIGDQGHRRSGDHRNHQIGRTTLSYAEWHAVLWPHLGHALG